MKISNILCCVGLLVSLGASVYASRTYVLHSIVTPRIEANSRVSDMILPKIEALLKDVNGHQLIIDELKFRQELNNSYSETMEQLNTAGKQRALVDLVAWIIVAVIFFVLQLRLYPLLKRGKLKSSD